MLKFLSFVFFFFSVTSSQAKSSIQRRDKHSPSMKVGQASAKRAQSSQRPRLEKYFVDPVKDFAWMTAQEKAAYVAFLYNLNLVIESELNKNQIIVAKEESRQEAQFSPALEIIREIFQPEQAHAVAGALIRVGGSLIKVAKNNKQVSTFVKQQQERVEVLTGQAKAAPRKFAAAGKVEDAAIVGEKSWWNKLPGIGTIAATTGAVALPLVLPDSEGQKEAAPLSGSAAADAMVATAAKEEPITIIPDPVDTTPTKPETQRVAQVDGSRKEGSFCIFGGHASSYIVAGGRAFCPAPPNTVNADICSRKGFSPSFLCQNFGLSTRADLLKVSDALCVPLRSGKGLQDLTVRCAKAFNENFLPNVQALDAAALSQIQEQVKKGVAELEAARGIGEIGILAYCQDGNSLNKGRQRSECSALVSILEKFRSEARTIAAAAEASPAESSNHGAGEVPASFPEDGQR